MLLPLLDLNDLACPAFVGGPPTASWLMLGLGVWLLCMVAGSVKRKDQPAAAGDAKRCDACNAGHPDAANYCRHCGRRL